MHYSPAEGVSAERSGQRMVVLDATGRVLTTLNPVGTIVWERLPADFASLLAQLTEDFSNVERSSLADDLRAFLAELSSADLIVTTDAEG